ncbi:MAG: hypothetical protein PHV43_01360 [Candidatus Colwellbacteria bacterium]|nr:hypothetical protein [Candidatus Colwellbacteria bacterium]
MAIQPEVAPPEAEELLLRFIEKTLRRLRGLRHVAPKQLSKLVDELEGDRLDAEEAIRRMRERERKRKRK